jgi:galactose oxidase
VQASSLITIKQVGQAPGVKKLSGMKKGRVYGNAVVLPDGKVFVTGGASKPEEFTDKFAHFQPGALQTLCTCMHPHAHACTPRHTHACSKLHACVRLPGCRI